MSEVSVLFQGMILWWAASDPAVVLIPNLTTIQAPHTASISAPPSAFDGGACPAGFIDVEGNCVFVLDRKGKAGGVQIELRSNVAAPTSLTKASMCPLPRLQHTESDPLDLRTEYKAGSGTMNTAWMSVQGGAAAAYMESCPNKDGDCPRFVKWTVPAGANSDVVLVLKNLAAGSDRLIPLNAGAELIIANVPVPAVVHERFAKRRAGSKKKVEHRMTDAAPDWCSYFSMVELRSNPAQAMQCPGEPSIPHCMPLLTLRRRGRGHGMQTIACSSSGYP